MFSAINVVHQKGPAKKLAFFVFTIISQILDKAGGYYREKDNVYKRFFQIGFIRFLIVLFCYFLFSYSVVRADSEINQEDICIHDRNHRYNTLVISCIDVRFVSFIRLFLTENLKINDDYDHVAIPGSIMNIIGPGGQKATFNEIDVSINLHHVKRLVLIEHKDCSGYGGSKQFGSEVEETETLSNNLKRIRNILREKHPNLEIDLFLASIKTVDTEKFYYMERIK